MIAFDEPRHRRQRVLVQHDHSRAGVKDQRHPIKALVAEQVDGVAVLGEFDAIDGLTAQLPGRPAGQLIGFEANRGPDPRRSSDQVILVDMRQSGPPSAASAIPTSGGH
jgi:cytochrome P450